MAKKKQADVLLQRYVASLSADFTGAGSDVATVKINTAINSTQRMGILIDHIDYFSLYPSDVLVNTADDLRFGLGYHETPPQNYGYDPADEGWLDIHIQEVEAFGTPANGLIMDGKIGTSDFRYEPGGGRIVIPVSLYFWAGTNTGSLQAVAQLRACIYFRYIEITDEFYRESLEMRLALTTV